MPVFRSKWGSGESVTLYSRDTWFKLDQNTAYSEIIFVDTFSLSRQLPRYCLELPKIASFQITPQSFTNLIVILGIIVGNTDSILK
jgi:hypothetical protein